MFLKTAAVRDNLMNSYPYNPKYISEKYTIIANLKATSQQLDSHPIYTVLSSHYRIKAFILYHIFDAWDTNKLVLPLQKKINLALLDKFSNCHPELKTLLEQTIFNRPRELCDRGKLDRDFANYLRAIAEIGLDSDWCLQYFLEAPNNLAVLKPEIKALVEFNSSLANWGTISEMIAVLLLEREQLALRVFTKIVRVLKMEAKECPFLIEYTKKLERKQSDSSQLLAFKLLNYFCQDEAEQIRALQTGLKALHLRKQLWNYALVEIRKL